MKKSTPRLSHQPPNGIDSEEYESLAKLIEPYADGPFDKLHDGLRQCVIEAFDFESEPFGARQWDELTPSKRRSLARDYDADHDPTKKIEQVAGMHEVDYRPNHLQAWLTMGAVSPLEAALLFFGQNPSKFKSTPPDMGEDFDLMERSFEDAARDGQVRSLNEWLSLARSRELNPVGLDGWEACATIAARATESAPTQTATPVPVATDGDAPAKHSNRKPSWATVAMPYMKSLFTAGNYKSASMFYKALMRRSGESDSPFKLVNRELYCTEAGTTVSEGSVGNKWPQIRAH